MKLSEQVRCGRKRGDQQITVVAPAINLDLRMPVELSLDTAGGKLAVNGKEVSGGSECRPRKGHICLESEGSECHFRNLRIQELPSTDPKPEEIAEAPQGCEDCYVPLLVMGQSLEELASAGGAGAVTLITTYERDSIWQVERGLSLPAADVSPRERVVKFRARRYRYQEVAPAEILRLLERPEGTIPIHRLKPVPDRSALEDLIGAFR